MLDMVVETNGKATPTLATDEQCREREGRTRVQGVDKGMPSEETDVEVGDQHNNHDERPMHVITVWHLRTQSARWEKLEDEELRVKVYERFLP